MTVLYIFYIIC